MDELLEKSLLYDFYGELLSEKQKNIYEDVVFNDFSLSEVASSYGISRQGVFDTIKRCNHSLSSYEEKLGLVNKFLDISEKSKEIDNICKDIKLKLSNNDEKDVKSEYIKNLSLKIDEIMKLTNTIVDEL